MRSFFPIFSSHIDLAHHYWKKIIHPGDTVIDATCGNGKDLLVLAKAAIIEDRGRVFGMDIQQEAIERSLSYIKEHLPESAIQRVYLVQRSHAEFPKECNRSSVKLIVYNLGYLPNGNKELTTTSSTTLVSVDNGLHLLENGGAMSITCYPGHPEGKKEEEALIAWLKTLNPKYYSVCHHRWLNRNDSPSLILIQKSL
jgi:SAM-dependent methyltransferase